MMGLRVLLSTFAMCCTLSAAYAQGLFSPVITVDDKAITGYEIDQRVKLLEVFRTPGDIATLAREQLVDDRLKQTELERVGAVISEEALQNELEQFAGRANLELSQFLVVLQQNGIAPETLSEFVEIGVIWRDYIRTRFGPRVQITEADIDRAIGQTGDNASNIEVLLSEIIIPAPPERAAQASALAERISRITSTSGFSAEAQRVSALPSRENGGRLGWLPIANYPTQIRTLILDLDIGEVTAPIPIPNGIALFQMRGVREVASRRTAPNSIEYAAFYVGSPAEAAAVASRVDTCDDLYGEAKGLPEEQLERQTLPVNEIPQDVAIELARLDQNEISTSLTRSNGETTVVLMLCNRLYGDDTTVDRDAVRNQLLSQRLAGFADALREDLRAAATIDG